MSDSKPVALGPEQAGISFANDGRYLFASKQHAAAIGLHEVPQMVTIAPLLLINGKNGWRLLAATSMAGSDNLLVGPKGAWLAAHIPERLAMYPLTLVVDGASAEGSLALVADSPRISQSEEGKLLDMQGEPTELYQGFIKALTRHALSDKRIGDIAEKLLEKGCLKEMQRPEGQEDAPTMYGANIGAMQDLSAPDLHELLKCGGLALGYALHFSNANVKKYQRMLKRQPQAQGVPQEAAADNDWLAQEPVTGFNFDVE